MNAKAKFGLAILTMAFLLLNPLGACTLMSVASAPAHPCCPKAPAPLRDCHTVGWVCVSTPPAPTTVAPNTDQGPVLAVFASATPVAGQVASSERPTFSLTSSHLTVDTSVSISFVFRTSLASQCSCKCIAEEGGIRRALRFSNGCGGARPVPDE
jgi:hypothetical protein